MCRDSTARLPIAEVAGLTVPSVFGTWLAVAVGVRIHTLASHFGWITSVQYLGPNTIVSASTVRSVVLWDTRVRNSPLFMLRHHQAPISDMLVGTKAGLLMVSMVADGAVAT